MNSSSCAIITFLLLFIGCSARNLYPLPSNKKEKTPKLTKEPLQTFRPFNVAHRGSYGEFPEETGPAYLKAIAEGADFIEADILVSKDGVLMCHHDVILDDTTDIAEHKQFADRKRTYEVEGANMTGYFIFDFTLKELKTLRTKQRYAFRDQQYNGMFPLITFEEYIFIALSTPRTVGIYPEIKSPVLMNQHLKLGKGRRFEDVIVETLVRYGYKGAYMSNQWLRQPCFIQSFAPSSLVYIHNKTDLPKILLIDDVDVRTQDTNQTFWEITSNNYFDYIKEYVVGIGPWKDTIVPVKDNYIQRPTDLVSRAHTHNLQVHPYTFRNENQFVHFNFSEDPYNEFDYWINIMEVDGLFTDFAGSLHHFQEWTSPSSREKRDATKLLNMIFSMILKFQLPGPN